MRERLYRSRTDRMLFGVAGGLARYLNLDSAIVRLVWVLLFLAGGAGILLYIVAAIVIPEEPEGVASSAAGPPGAGFTGGGQARTGMGNGPIILGIVLVLVGGWLLLERFIDIDGRDVWPIVILALGLVLVLGALRGRGRT